MSEVAICNQALGWLGESPITDFTDPTRIAGLCALNYAPIRDAVLEAHNWTFATKRYNIAKAVTGPAFGYANRYPIPGEVLQVLEVNRLTPDDPRGTWFIEDGHIITDDNECKMIAIFRVTDTNAFSSLFTQALAQRIASDLAIGVTGSRTLQQQHWQLYTAKLREASSRDGQQGKSKRLRSRYMERARLSSGPRSTAGPEV